MKPKKYFRIPEITIPLWWPDIKFNWRSWLPSRGNVLFTLLAITLLIGAQSVGAVPGRAPAATSTGTVAYQGRLADSAGAPLTGTYGMIFRLYNVAANGSPLWTENWVGPNSVVVSDGLFNVMLGSLTPIPQSVITGNNALWLGITVGADNEMAPRVQLGSVPFAVQALTVPDGSVTTAKIADGAVTGRKILRTTHQAFGSLVTAIPVPNTLYAVNAISITLEQETLVTIYSAVAAYNLTSDAIFNAYLHVDSVAVVQGQNWHHVGVGEQIMLVYSQKLSPGNHQIQVYISPYDTTTSLVANDNRTYLLVIEN